MVIPAGTNPEAMMSK
jgi:hypothetical protein